MYVIRIPLPKFLEISKLTTFFACQAAMTLEMPQRKEV
jgi:hypothetical protein